MFTASLAGNSSPLSNILALMSFVSTVGFAAGCNSPVKIGGAYPSITYPSVPTKPTRARPKTPQMLEIFKTSEIPETVETSFTVSDENRLSKMTASESKEIGAPLWREPCYIGHDMSVIYRTKQGALLVFTHGWSTTLLGMNRPLFSAFDVNRDGIEDLIINTNTYDDLKLGSIFLRTHDALEMRPTVLQYGLFYGPSTNTGDEPKWASSLSWRNLASISACVR